MFYTDETKTKTFKKIFTTLSIKFLTMLLRINVCEFQNHMVAILLFATLVTMFEGDLID